MARIVMAAALAALGNYLLYHAIRSELYGDRDRFWIMLAASVPFVLGSCFVLWKGFPAHDPDTVQHVGSRGLGPGWRCAPTTDFCVRDPQSR